MYVTVMCEYVLTLDVDDKLDMLDKSTMKMLSLFKLCTSQTARFGPSSTIVTIYIKNEIL